MGVFASREPNPRSGTRPVSAQTNCSALALDSGSQTVALPIDTNWSRVGSAQQYQGS